MKTIVLLSILSFSVFFNVAGVLAEDEAAVGYDTGDSENSYDQPFGFSFDDIYANKNEAQIGTSIETEEPHFFHRTVITDDLAEDQNGPKAATGQSRGFAGASEKA